MNYLTNYYKNLSEQLQERVNKLTALLEAATARKEFNFTKAGRGVAQSDNDQEPAREETSEPGDPFQQIRTVDPVRNNEINVDLLRDRQQNPNPRIDPNKEIESKIVVGSVVAPAAMTAGALMHPVGSAASAALGGVALPATLVAGPAMYAGYKLGQKLGMDVPDKREDILPLMDKSGANRPATPQQMQQTRDEIRNRQIRLYGNPLK